MAPWQLWHYVTLTSILLTFSLVASILFYSSPTSSLSLSLFSLLSLLCRPIPVSLILPLRLVLHLNGLTCLSYHLPRAQGVWTCAEDWQKRQRGMSPGAIWKRGRVGAQRQQVKMYAAWTGGTWTDVATTDKVMRLVGRVNGGHTWFGIREVA